jgi:hypothetical protein
LRALRQALAHPHYAPGLILDGVASALVPPAVAGRSLLQALGLTLKLPPPVPPLPLTGAKGKAGAGAARKPPSQPLTRVPEEPPPDPSRPDEWLGTQIVHALELILQRDEAAARLAAAQEHAAAEQQPSDGATGLKPVREEEDEAGRQAAGTVSESPPEGNQQRPGSQGSQPEPGHTLEAPQQAEQSSQKDQQAEAQGGFGELWEAYEAAAAVLAPVLGALQARDGPIRHRAIDARAEQDAVAAAVVGVSYSLGRLSTILPAASEDALRVPPPYELRILQRPKARQARGSANFRLWTAPNTPTPAAELGAEGAFGGDGRSPSPAPSAAAAKEVAAPKKSAGATPRKGRKGEPAAIELTEPVVPDEERWVGWLLANAGIICCLRKRDEARML